MTGKFITFEGGEGSGKSTQVRLLAERLAARGLAVVETREPGGSPFAERLRTILLDAHVEAHSPLSEALLFYAARADHLEKTIRPALARGAWVLCDRFSDSTRVYQVLAGDLAQEVFESLERHVVLPTKPNLTLILDVPVETGLARASLRRTDPRRSGNAARSLLADRYESRDVDYHRRLRAGFLEIAAAEPDRCAVIDGQNGAEEVSEAIWSAVAARLLPATG